MRDQTRGNFSLSWSDRDGNEDLLPVPHDNHVYPRESPDGTPVQLFDTTRPPRILAGRPYDISPIDGRFLFSRFHPDQNQPPGPGNVSVILNWGSELEAQLGAQ
jgi:hypothetical protein